ncbi:hypothetical protein PoB_000790400 [Plakobranchus ocellatus]|uniref:Uncharacterized protein n=1 Tax=Plakobranchus ocellatus TaxID=259542 RepID=A0AAV3YHA8_9GAST|nr:hypothetical protein PoB_000790400 [Plakobranchus ocellatus]
MVPSSYTLTFYLGHGSWGLGATVDSEPALRSAGIVLLLVRARHGVSTLWEHENLISLCSIKTCNTKLNHSKYCKSVYLLVCLLVWSAVSADACRYLNIQMAPFSLSKPLFLSFGAQGTPYLIPCAGRATVFENNIIGPSATYNNM